MKKEEVELSADGFTLEQFLHLVKDNCSNVEFNRSNGFVKTTFQSKLDFEQSIKHMYNLSKYRIIPSHFQVEKESEKMNEIEIKEETYRSKSLVNMTDDMIMVTLYMSRNKWHMVKKLIFPKE